MSTVSTWGDSLKAITGMATGKASRVGTSDGVGVGDGGGVGEGVAPGNGVCVVAIAEAGPGLGVANTNVLALGVGVGLTKTSSGNVSIFGCAQAANTSPISNRTAAIIRRLEPKSFE